MHPDDRKFLLEQFASLRAEMGLMATKADLEELATYVQRGFSDVTLRLVRVEESVDFLVKRDFQGQIDHLRDDMRLVKTRLGM